MWLIRGVLVCVLGRLRRGGSLAGHLDVPHARRLKQLHLELVLAQSRGGGSQDEAVGGLAPMDGRAKQEVKWLAQLGWSGTPGLDVC